MIGIFDSGLGGLTVVKEIKKVLPTYDLMYLGDTLHVPYGNRSDEAVYELTKKACDFLFDKGCQLIIVACNTATAKSLRKLQQEYLPLKKNELQNENINILGVVRPVAEYFAQFGGQRIGVIGTRGTINSKIYINEIKALKPTVKIYQQATPVLVPLIEENFLKKVVLKKILRNYLSVLKLKKVNSLILGCTHYPMILGKVEQVMGKSCQVPNPAQIVAQSLVEYLNRHSEIEENLNQNSQIKYYVTDINENFLQVAKVFMAEKMKIKIEKAVV
jgi:glutamate racemase